MLMKIKIGYHHYLVPNGDPTMLGALLTLRQIENKGKIWFPVTDDTETPEVTFLKDEEFSETASEKTVSKTIADLVKERDAQIHEKWKVERERDAFKKQLEGAGIFQAEKKKDEDLPF